LGADLLARQKAGGPIEVPVILLTPAGAPFDQETARQLECYGHVALICGRYEGVDQRVTDMMVTHELSIGDYVLSGGEIPAMVVVEAVTRLVLGVGRYARRDRRFPLFRFARVSTLYAAGRVPGLRVPDILLSATTPGGALATRPGAATDPGPAARSAGGIDAECPRSACAG
jgi:tRNA (guanine37-N1)-methyltransferase